MGNSILLCNIWSRYYDLSLCHKTTAECEWRIRDHLEYFWQVQKQRPREATQLQRIHSASNRAGIRTRSRISVCLISSIACFLLSVSGLSVTFRTYHSSPYHLCHLFHVPISLSSRLISPITLQKRYTMQKPVSNVTHAAETHLEILRSGNGGAQNAINKTFKDENHTTLQHISRITNSWKCCYK